MEYNNERPIIGILAQEVTDLISKKYPYSKSYIAASYVKAIEGSGARAVPVFLGKNEEYYRTIIKFINGLVLPGGNVWFYKYDDKTPKENGYLRAAEILYSEIKKVNQEDKDSFPILGICLGIEVMLFLDSYKKECRKEGKLNLSALPLYLQEGYEDSRLFADLNNNENIRITLKEPVNYFNHQFYITKETIENDLQDWKILTISEDKKKNKEFVSIVESRNYPFVGLQFHPEKIYEWYTNFNYQHSYQAITLSRFFFDWLIKQSKLSKNKFPSMESENASLIYNYQKTFTAEKLNFDELYLFDENNMTLIQIKNSSLIHFVI